MTPLAARNRARAAERIQITELRRDEATLRRVGTPAALLAADDVRRRREALERPAVVGLVTLPTTGGAYVYRDGAEVARLSDDERAASLLERVRELFGPSASTRARRLRLLDVVVPREARVA